MLYKKYKNKYNTNFFIKRLIDNCHTSGEHCTIIASPSKDDPNYYFEWIRDSSLVINMLLNLINKHIITHKSVCNIIQNFVYNHLYFQNICIYEKHNYTDVNISLGEAKLNVDASPYTGKWGRPQNDGPAIRSIAMIKYAIYLLKNEKYSQNFVTKNLYDTKWPSHTLIKRDLEYICENYKNRCYDLWEEINGYHFYTLMVQKKSLILGIELAILLNDNHIIEHYSYTIEQINNMLNNFYYDNKIGSSYGLIDYYPDHRSYDMSILLAFIHTDSEYNTELANTMCDIIRIFRNEYSINGDNELNPTRMIVGRYPNDTYYGGNPWILTTVALSYYLFSIDIDKLDQNILNKDFYEIFGKNEIEIRKNALAILETIFDIENIADNKSFAEQINRNDYHYLSADRLTWNYVEILRVLIFNTISIY